MNKRTGYKILNEHMVIPGGWHYRVPETGIEIAGGSWPQLHEFIKNHYNANAIQIPANLDELIVEYACRNGADCTYDEVELSKPAGRKSLEIGRYPFQHESSPRIDHRWRESGPRRGESSRQHLRWMSIQ